MKEPASHSNRISNEQECSVHAILHCRAYYNNIEAMEIKRQDRLL